MKNETKLKIAAVSAVFALATLIGTVVLVAINHHAQWDAAGAFSVSFGITLFTICTID